MLNVTKVLPNVIYILLAGFVLLATHLVSTIYSN